LESTNYKKKQLEPLNDQAIDLAERSQQQALDAQNITEQQSRIASKELARMTEAKAHMEAAIQECKISKK